MLTMVTSLNRLQVHRLLDEGAQLIEVLPAAEYDDEHLRGARNLPLKILGSDTVAGLERDVPVIVYCWDGL
jgi:rhodanese-related sulfurtransferase